MTAETPRWDRWAPAAVLAVALMVRLWELDAKSLWIDEGASWVFARQPLSSILFNMREKNPPLYYAMLHGCMTWFGESESALRGLSVVWGLVAVALTGWVGRLLGGPRVGLAAMGLMAVLPMPVEHSQTARGYSLFLAMTLAGFGCLLQWEATRRKRGPSGMQSRRS